ncbi:type VI secretion system-associated FHA domain protein [Sphingomonas aerolata]|uniref:type VI secretion system-associated FHA domain protein n=1 Tax=Sphingomonas aerolata TaxID=185951 RepID=UPI00141B01C6|nr:type VI secretion system-associated FHA domain protein [Sphingomonas aerolata]NII57083.1 putative component of type VI protein secretion system [Sphingomonas aerolata]
MYMLQLFDRDDMVQPLDARLIREGLLRIGRDTEADWPIADPDCALSRAHCELRVDGDGLTLRALGANGVFDADTGQRFPDAVDVVLPVPSALRLGRFKMVATQAPHGDLEVDGALTMVLTPPLGSSVEVPSEWADAGEARPPGDGSLLEAFCEGAGLDCSLLSEEEPTEIMRRAGAVYRQMVLGIGDLMAERDHARGRYQLTRTTISGADNNPFKWAPTQRLAIDLLLAGSTGFLSGPAALKASFRDVKRHLVATFAGLQGSLRAAIGTFEPASVDAAIADRATLLKSRASLQMAEVADRHADLTRQIVASAPGSLDRAFALAYDAADTAMARDLA